MIFMPPFISQNIFVLIISKKVVEIYLDIRYKYNFMKDLVPLCTFLPFDVPTFFQNFLVADA